jgi:hypothetical protein
LASPCLRGPRSPGGFLGAITWAGLAPAPGRFHRYRPLASLFVRLVARRRSKTFVVLVAGPVLFLRVIGTDATGHAASSLLVLHIPSLWPPWRWPYGRLRPPPMREGVPGSCESEPKMPLPLYEDREGRGITTGSCGYRCSNSKNSYPEWLATSLGHRGLLSISRDSGVHLSHNASDLNRRIRVRNEVMELGTVASLSRLSVCRHGTHWSTSTGLTPLMVSSSAHSSHGGSRIDIGGPQVR